MRGWLDSIARTGSVSKAEERVIAKRLRDTVKIEALPDLEDGRLVERRTYYLEGVQACYAFACALLLRLRGRLGRCRLPKCETPFFFNTATRGAPPRYCSTQHANADRRAAL